MFCSVRRVCLEDVSLLTDEFQLGHHSHSPRSSMHSSRSKTSGHISSILKTSIPFDLLIFRTASLSPNADRTRDFVGQGQTPEEKEEEARHAKEQEEREMREKEEMDLPLQLATLPGKQEIVLKFTEMNQVNEMYKRKFPNKEITFQRLRMY